MPVHYSVLSKSHQGVSSAKCQKDTFLVASTNEKFEDRLILTLLTHFFLWRGRRIRPPQKKVIKAALPDDDSDSASSSEESDSNDSK